MLLKTRKNIHEKNEFNFNIEQHSNYASPLIIVDNIIRKKTHNGNNKNNEK